MITSKQELKFYIMADMMMNRGKFHWSLKDRLIHILIPDDIMSYLKSLRYCDYYSNNRKNKFLYRLYKAYYAMRRERLGLKLGFSMGCSTLGYGVVFPHYGTIVLGYNNRIGNYSVFHTSTCIVDAGSHIGNALFLATGAKITKNITLGDNVSVGANSVVNKSFGSNILIAGSPAEYKKVSGPWYMRPESKKYLDRITQIESLKSEMGI